ncbi:SRPBCC family protein [Streptomyces sp. AK02-01A]|uniref:SRPBCC family protein n=1 Tax=Streptomyces sp. AK02-01A TaxID=3028648 RepID=UPI0029BC353D|nr:SRPBCC family protein [Streptomyces sp. AK02-01A]MDX3852432.1 SRPBCC family protein [Streptomyces sp. AK02-01A]
MNTNPHDDTLTTADGRTALRMERRLAHPPEKVWAAITDPAGLRQWFPSEVSVELVPGGAMGFRFPGVSGPGMTGTVTGVDEPRLFAFTWGADHLSWTITPDGEGSLLTLVHTFDDLPGAASFASGWHLCVAALERLLDGDPVPAGRDTGELHESYVREFGLGHGVVDSEAGVKRIRLERQLVRPAETVWEVLSAGIEPVAGLPVPEGFTAEKVPAGHVTEVRAPKSLTYTWDPDAAVSWELGEGTGHGARLVVTQTGPPDVDTDAALAAWRTRIERLAAELLDQ